VMDGSVAASFSADFASAGSRTRLTSFPPCGATSDIEKYSFLLGKRHRVAEPSAGASGEIAYFQLPIAH
jgi:hypothetical protein